MFLFQDLDKSDDNADEVSEIYLIRKLFLFYLFLLRPLFKLSCKRNIFNKDTDQLINLHAFLSFIIIQLLSGIFLLGGGGLIFWPLFYPH